MIIKNIYTLILTFIILGCSSGSIVRNNFNGKATTANQEDRYHNITDRIMLDRDLITSFITNNYNTGLISPKLSPTQSSLADRIIVHGMNFLGGKYKYGGESPSEGFDCSGFIYYLFKQESGISIPRTTSELGTIQAPIVAKHDLLPGDIVFFYTKKPGIISHTGIYMGNNHFIHAASTKSGVRIDSLSNQYWNPRYIASKRLIENNTVLASVAKN